MRRELPFNPLQVSVTEGILNFLVFHKVLCSTRSWFPKGRRVCGSDPRSGSILRAVCVCISAQVGRVYPQAVYFPIRTLYLTLKIEQRERYKSGEPLPSHCSGYLSLGTWSFTSFDWEHGFSRNRTNLSRPRKEILINFVFIRLFL